MHVYVGLVPTTLASGRPVSFGERLDLSKRQLDANAALIDAGHLIPASEFKRQRGAKKHTNPGEEDAA